MVDDQCGSEILKWKNISSHVRGSLRNPCEVQYLRGWLNASLNSIVSLVIAVSWR